ncbi:MAG: hypothetical protein U0326_35710 [Polyangiales bacterium]
MRPMLLPCPACHRHVRSGASACPFCEAPLDGAARPDDAPDTRGWKRAAIFTFGAALSLTACSSTTTGSDAAPQDSATDTAPMDAPLTDTSPTDTSPTDASRTDVVTDTAVDNGGIAPPYGIAPTDAGPPDDGSFKADYGAPPPRDAGTD